MCKTFAKLLKYFVGRVYLKVEGRESRVNVESNCRESRIKVESRELKVENRE